MCSRYAALTLLRVGLALASGCGVFRDVSRGVVFQPERPRPDEQAPARIPGLERWWIDVEGGQVEAWYLPPRRASETRSPAVVFAHGSAELIDGWAERLEPYRAMGLAVLLVEYRGHGRSSGQPSEAAILGDYAHFYDRLSDRPEIDATRIVFHGRALGGGVVGTLCSRRRAAALILESTFTSVPDAAGRWFVPSAVLPDRFDTREVLMRSSTPVLILHGLEDELIPVRHARELHRVAWDSRLVTYRGVGHDLPRTERAYWSRIRRFLRESRVLEPTAPRARLLDGHGNVHGGAALEDHAADLEALAPHEHDRVVAPGADRRVRLGRADLDGVTAALTL
jgi:pimeloyl-ACP methyl ester carboxylesterase